MKLNVLFPFLVLLSLFLGVSCSSNIGPDELATTIHEQCVAELNSGKLEQAKARCSRALSIRKNDLGEEHAATIQTLEKLATIYRALGNGTEAEKLFREALRVKESKLVSEDARIASTLNNLAGVVEDLGRYREAEILYNRAVKISEQSNGTDDARTATILNNLAVLFEKQQRFVEAEVLQRRALSIREKQLGIEHPRYASSLNNLAVVLHRLGQFEESANLLKTSIAIEEKARGPKHPLLGFPLNNLGASLEAAANFKEAERIYQRALLVRREGYGERHFLVAQTLRNLASLHLKRGDFERSEKYLNEALSISEETAGAFHPETRKILETSASLNVARENLSAALTNMKQVVNIDQRRLGRQGKKHLSPAELANLKSNAGKLLELIARSTTVLDDDSKTEALNAIQLVSGDSVGAAANDAVALFADRKNGLGSKIRELQVREEEVAATNERINRLVNQSISQTNSDALAIARNENDQASRAAEQLIEEIIKQFPAFSDLAIGVPVSMEQLQGQLSDDEAVINYAVVNNTAWPDQQASVFAIIVTRSAARFERVKLSAEELLQSVNGLRNQLESTTVNLAISFNTEASYRLYDLLLGPFSEELDDIRHLYVVADGPLELLPFSVLVTERPAPAASYSDVQWLARKMSVTTLPSAASLQGSREFAQSSSGSTPFLGVGDPLLSDNPADNRNPTIASLFDEQGLAEVVEVLRQAPALPETANELSAIASLLETDEESLLLREEATESVLKDMDLDDIRVFSFATHALVAGEISGVAEPALVLTPPNEPSALDDGLLTASEIGRFKLDADLVILSACNTAAPDGTLGAPGLSGLAKAFIFAGTRSLLVSHWAVLSDAAVELTTGMIEAELAEPGIGHAEALRRSMLKMVDNPSLVEHAHPGAWAPFVIVGDGRASLGKLR